MFLWKLLEENYEISPSPFQSFACKKAGELIMEEQVSSLRVSGARETETRLFCCRRITERWRLTSLSERRTEIAGEAKVRRSLLAEERMLREQPEEGGEKLEFPRKQRKRLSLSVFIVLPPPVWKKKTQTRAGCYLLRQKRHWQSLGGTRKRLKRIDSVYVLEVSMLFQKTAEGLVDVNLNTLLTKRTVL